MNTSPLTGLRGLRGLRVAITGGTSGLGLALTRALHARGAAVAFIARKPCKPVRGDVFMPSLGGG